MPVPVPHEIRCAIPEAAVSLPDAEHPSSGFRTALLHPTLDTIRFSLNGVSNVRAYDARKIVLLRLML